MQSLRQFAKRLLPNQTFGFVEALFLRLLGLVYLIAFASLWPQIRGLVGVNGVAPATDVLTAMRLDYGRLAFYYVPSLFWFSQTDGMLTALCAAGCLAGLCLLFGLFRRPAAAAAYVCYLSLVAVGQPFTSFQWDALLLESGFLAIFAGSVFVPIAYRLLLFRLFFDSGLVKLLSGDPNWRNLHALRFHFWTQPLPTPLAAYLHFWPGSLLDAITALTLAIEIGAPFLLFVTPRRIRLVAVILFVALQLSIALTGNYGFFNLLTITLCLWGLDDSFFPSQTHTPTSQWGELPAVLLAGLGCLQLIGLQPSFFDSLEIVNSYGLFAVMTTTRTELVLEGSNDGREWKEYQFRWKPGPVQRALPVIEPYQPRLDWQMWFASLGEPTQNRWVESLMNRLLKNQPEVLKLLERPPFSNPPHWIRVKKYQYAFNPPSGSPMVWRRSSDAVWLAPVALP